MNDILIWNLNIVSILNKNKVILANKENGNWIKISKECFEIINQIVESNITRSDIPRIFEYEEDREYFIKLIEKLDSMSAFVKKDIPNSNRIEHIYFSLTHRCNLRCSHCSVDAYYGLEKEVLCTASVLEILDKIIKAEPADLIFTGGEPFLREDIMEILRYTRKKFRGRIIVMTNATLISSQNVTEIVKYIDAIDISIDGVDEVSCSKIRGKGTFDKVIQAINLLKAENFQNISLSMVLSKENELVMDQFYELNDKLETKPIVRVFTARGRGKNTKSQFLSSKKKDNPTMTDAESYEKKKELYDTITPCCCGAAKNQITINYDGNIYPCGLLINKQYHLGHMYEADDLMQMINNKENKGLRNLNKIQPEKYEKCKNCNVNIFCWSCPEVIDRLHGTDEMDERCNGIRQYLSDTIWDTDYADISNEVEYVI